MKIREKKNEEKRKESKEKKHGSGNQSFPAGPYSLVLHHKRYVQLLAA
jgi:hypothetical protein